MQNKKEDKSLDQLIERAQNAAKAEAAPSSERNYRSKLFLLGLVLVGLIFTILTFLVRTNAYFPIDLKITVALQTITSPVVSLLMRAVSWPGYLPQSALLSILLIGLFGFYGFYWESMMCGFNAVFVTGVNALIKLAIQRVRPDANLVHVAVILNSFSFPSGHVMFYTGFFGFFGFLTYSIFEKSQLRTFILFIIGFLILLIGVSRIYLGEHWASDVVGAYLLGILTLGACVQIYRWGKSRYFVRQPAAGEKEQA